MVVLPMVDFIYVHETLTMNVNAYHTGMENKRIESFEELLATSHVPWNEKHVNTQI